MNNDILEAHLKAKQHKRKVDEEFYKLRSDVDEYTRSLFNTCADDDARKEVNSIRSSSGLLPLTWAKIHLPDRVFQLLIDKVMSGKKVKQAISEVEEVITLEQPLIDIVKQHHPYDWMDIHRNTIRSSVEYNNLLYDLGLHKNANILAKDKRPYTLLRRLERVIQKLRSYKTMENELTQSSKELEKLRAELRVVQMRIAMTAYDIDVLKKKLLEEPDPYERFKWTLGKFPDITTSDLVTFCGVTERQIRRYRKTYTESLDRQTG